MTDFRYPDSIDWFTVADGTRIRCGWWGGAASDDGDMVLILPGRSEFVEKYGEVAARIARRGVAVCVIDWRGQGLSEGHLAERRQIGHMECFDRCLTADLRQILTGLTHRKVTVLSHGMGSSVFLRLLQQGGVDTLSLTQGIALAPMLSVPERRYPGHLARMAAKLACWWGRKCDYVFGYEDWKAAHAVFERNGRTGDPARFQREIDLIAENPQLAWGGPSWGWLKAAIALTSQLQAGCFKMRRVVPVSLIQGDADRFAPLAVLKRFQACLPSGQVHVIADGQHELLMERDSIQEQVWAVMDPLLPGQREGMGSVGAGQTPASRKAAPFRLAAC